jgi:hypothetical protein
MFRNVLLARSKPAFTASSKLIGDAAITSDTLATRSITYLRIKNSEDHNPFSRSSHRLFLFVPEAGPQARWAGDKAMSIILPINQYSSLDW